MSCFSLNAYAAAPPRREAPKKMAGVFLDRHHLAGMSSDQIDELIGFMTDKKVGGETYGTPINTIFLDCFSWGQTLFEPRVRSVHQFPVASDVRIRSNWQRVVERAVGNGINLVAWVKTFYWGPERAHLPSQFSAWQLLKENYPDGFKVEKWWVDPLKYDGFYRYFETLVEQIADYEAMGKKPFIAVNLDYIRVPLIKDASGNFIDVVATEHQPTTRASIRKFVEDLHGQCTRLGLSLSVDVHPPRIAEKALQDQIILAELDHVHPMLYANEDEEKAFAQWFEEYRNGSGVGNPPRVVPVLYRLVGKKPLSQAALSRRVEACFLSAGGAVLFLNIQNGADPFMQSKEHILSFRSAFPGVRPGESSGPSNPG